MEAPRGVELTSTNSPCVLFSCNFLPSLVIIFDKISLVVMEERVHPTPFRTRQLSSPSPMILHNVMWESRPPPKIVRKAPAAVRAGAFFVIHFIFRQADFPSLPLLPRSCVAVPPCFRHGMFPSVCRDGQVRKTTVFSLMFFAPACGFGLA